MKRVGVFLFTLLFVGALVIIPCLAEGGYYNLYLSDSNTNAINNGFDVDFDYLLVYADTDISLFSGTFSNSLGYLSINSSLPSSGVIALINNSDSSYNVKLHTVPSTTYNSNDFIVPSHGIYELHYSRSNVADAAAFTVVILESFTEVDYNYSVFNADGIINTVGNVFGMIFNSSTILFPLFLIGITLSLGFVAIKFLRKVMWGN